MSKISNLGYSVFGGGGAAGSMAAGQSCIGSCAGCFSCVAFAGVLVSLALVKAIYRPKEEKHGLVTADN
jgi:hypothetical protein